MSIREQCSCGARIEVVGGRYRNDGHQTNPRSAEEVVERWRADHQHPAVVVAKPNKATP